MPGRWISFGYNIVAMSYCYPSPAADGNYPHWRNFWESGGYGSESYRAISFNRFNRNNMYNSTDWAPREFSKRVIACDLMYRPSPPAASYGGPNDYEQLKIVGGAHNWSGGSSVFGDGHTEHIKNPAGVAPFDASIASFIRGTSGSTI